LRKVTEKLAAVLEVQGFLIAVLPEERLTRTAVLHLLAAGNAQPDSWDVTFAETVSYLRFLAAVDQRATLYRPWSGLITVDTLIHSGVPVLRVAPGSPAAQAQVEPGAILYSVGTKPVARTAELISAMQEKKPGEMLGLHFHTTNGDRAVDLKLAETPQELPLNDPSLLYNKVMMDLRQQVEAYPGTEGAALARLNLAICAMHFGDFAAAHEHLLKAKVELPARPGISQGTALYYLGLSMEHLNYVKEAGEFYRAAASFKDATLVNNDGPSVAPLAARRAGGAP
jgi:tetratricopeptide (TPR) repeat protein